ncbi:MAG TPA: biotin-dependent carboxyltransferase family protein [Puia sp.]|nr:biotin-dependent carboxyltransferase family protein [Puia sp.]
MSISVIKPGLLDTIQDIGRYGYAKWGINPGGAMDVFAAKVANILVGNCPNESVLEIHFPGPQLLFEQNTLISLTGANFSPTLNDEPLKLWQPVVVRKNTVLHFPKLRSGARCYVAVHGGFCIEKWLDSYSTNLKAGAGGWFGRQLKKGDDLTFKENTIYFAGLLDAQNNKKELPWHADERSTYDNLHEILMIPGNEWEDLTDNSQKDFLKNDFMIHHSSDRMGYQFNGEKLVMKNNSELISSGVSFGTIQLLPDGHMIVLMADHQITGGYPRIGHVISAHLHKLAQLRQKEIVRFRMTDIRTAEELLFLQQRQLQILQRACTDHLNQLIC